MIEVKITGESWGEVAGQIAGITGAGPRVEWRDAVVSASSSGSPNPRDAQDDSPSPDEDDARAYGATGEGRKRRTKEEMAEDQEIYELSERLGMKKIPTDVPATSLLAELRERAAAGGASAEDEPKEVSGEIVDETAVGDDEKVYTRDDVREALAAYAEKHGMAKAQEEGPKLMGAPRLSAIEDDPAAFKKAALALKEAT